MEQVGCKIRLNGQHYQPTTVQTNGKECKPSLTSSVEKANLVGTLNRGWDVAKHLLAHERTMIGAMGDAGVGRPLGQVAAESVGLDETGRLDEPMLRARIAELRTLVGVKP